VRETLMNRTIGIASYSLHIRPRRSTREHLLLGQLDPNRSLHQFLHSFFDGLRRRHRKSDEETHLLRVKELDADRTDVWGTVEAGEYGYAASGVDVETLTARYQRKPTDAELIPFFFRAHAPAKTDCGVLLVQRFGAIGVFSILAEALATAFAKAFPDLILDLSRLVPAHIIESLSNGVLQEVQLTTYQVPGDIADKFRFLGNVTEAGSMTVTLRAKRKSALADPSWLRAIRKGRVDIVEIPESLGGKSSRLALKLTYGGKSRRVHLDKPDAISPYTDITNDVTLLETGHPSYESLRDVTLELRRELMRQLGKGS